MKRITITIDEDWINSHVEHYCDYLSSEDKDKLDPKKILNRILSENDFKEDFEDLVRDAINSEIEYIMENE